jgi:hypothetical protein
MDSLLLNPKPTTCGWLTTITITRILSSGDDMRKLSIILLLISMRIVSGCAEMHRELHKQGVPGLVAQMHDEEEIRPVEKRVIRITPIRVHDWSRLAEDTGDSKVTALGEVTNVQGSYILYIIEDPGGSPVSKKITVLNLFDFIDTPAELETIANLGTFFSDYADDADAATFRATIGAEGTLTNAAGLYAALSDVSLFLEDLVDDTTPQLGGNLDLNGKLITEATETTFTESACPTVDLATAKREIIFNNSGSTPTDISAFSNAVTGAWYHVTFQDATFTVDFTGTNFYGHAQNDWTPRAEDSAFFSTQDGTKFNWIISMPSSIPIDEYHTLPFNPYGLSDDTWVGPTQPGRAGEALAQWDTVACRSEGAGKPCYWYKYNAATGDGDKTTWPTGIATEAITAAATSGSLVVGEVYILTDWITADDFTNVGAASNADGVIFTATGTTPTTWTNSSVVNQLGNIGSGHGYARNDGWTMTANQDEGKFVFASDTTDGGILLAVPTDTGDQICLLGKILDASGYVGDIVEFNFTGLCAEE